MKRILFIFLFFSPFFLIAQTVSLFKQFNGRYDFTTFGNTLNIEENNLGGACVILTESSAQFSLEPQQEILSAHLYWAGSGTGDFNVQLNGIPVTASRSFSHVSFNLPFFSAYAEVTDILISNGNGTYTLSDLDLNDAIPPYCGSLNFGGWAINVIYEDVSLTLNQISLFDGLESVSRDNPLLEIVLGNIEVASQDLAKIGFLAWEGDNVTAPVNESLKINGVLMSNELNPADNAFNCTNSYNGSVELWNMDLDSYSIDNVIGVGDTSIDITLTSGLDFVLINNIITVINSELPDATIEVDAPNITCGSNEVDIPYTVFNVNSTEFLPAGTEIAFYADNTLVGQSQTVLDIPIGGMEAGLITLTIPANIPSTFVLRASVDDDGTGTGSVAETDESNNEFEVIVSLAPIFINPPPFSITLCDDLVNGSTSDDGISTFNLAEFKPEIIGTFNFSVFYYLSINDQTNGIAIDPDNAFQNTSSPQTLYVSVFNSAGCDITTELTLIVEPNPVAVPPTPLQVCDDDNDGFFVFNLRDKDLEITGGATDVFVNYYGTQALAEQGDPNAALPIPYNNDDPFFDNVWARVESTTTGCFDVVELELIVNLLPLVPTEEFGDLIMCDDDGNGIEQFDLTINTPFVLGSQDPADFTINYYTSLIEAEIPLNEVTTPTSFISTGQPIWVRIEDINTTCYRISEFQLIVGTMPILGTGPFMAEACDDTLNGSTSTDGISTFNLALNNLDITAGDTSLAVFYYETQAAQNANDPIIPDTEYQNIVTPQTLFVSVFNTEFCESRTLLTLTVNNNPSPKLPTPLEVCDDNRDGFAEFTLEDKDVEITGNEANVVINYFETMALAELGDLSNALVSPYVNEVPDNDRVWVRVTYDPLPPINGTGCFTVIPLELIVNPLPEDSVIIENVIHCQVPLIGTSTIILDTKDSEILNGQDPAIFDVLYFETEFEADTMTDPISSSTPFLFGTTEVTLHVGILNLETGCYVSSNTVPEPSVLTFDLVVKEGATATTPAEPYVICDNFGENDGIVGTFTLISNPDDPTEYDAEADALAAEILGVQDPSQYEVSYHVSIENAIDGTNALPNTYQNIINPQLIYARVTNGFNTEPECYSVVEVALKVEQLPVLMLEPEYRLCVDARGDPIPEEEGGASPPVLDTGLDPELYLFEWSLDDLIINGAIAPAITALEGGNYTVTATEIATRCTNSQTVTVTLSSPPLTYSAEVVSAAFAINEVIYTNSAGTTQIFNDTHVIYVQAEGLGTYIYQLDDGPFQEGSLFTNNVLPGSHVVTIKDVNGCGSQRIDVNVIDYPRFLTPNQDGFHDTWNIIGIAEFDPTAKIYIFDRFGKLLKQISPIDGGWDGNYKGNPLPSSDYWFLVEYLEGGIPKEIKGHFTLKR